MATRAPFFWRLGLGSLDARVAIRPLIERLFFCYRIKYIGSQTRSVCAAKNRREISRILALYSHWRMSSSIFATASWRNGLLVLFFLVVLSRLVIRNGSAIRSTWTVSGRRGAALDRRQSRRFDVRPKVGRRPPPRPAAAGRPTLGRCPSATGRPRRRRH